MRTILLFIAFSFYLQAGNAQAIVKYFDSAWAETPKTTAFYSTEFIKEGRLYKASSYWVRSKKLYSVSFYTDTTFSQNVGSFTKYYESGQLEDSSYYGADEVMFYSYYYYPNGKLWVHYTYDESSEQEITEAYDENGKPIKDFTYLREAEFKGGNEAWQQFLSTHVKPKVPIKKNAPAGTYQVIIRFIVDTDGKITDIQAETNLGYGMEEEAIRVIKKSPSWMPAIWLNKTVKAYRRQPLTFVVSEE